MYSSGDITIDYYIKRITVMLIIFKKKKDKIGVAEQNISSSDEETGIESYDSSDSDSDNAPDSDDVDESRSTELIQTLDNLAVSNIKCDSNTKCKTKRCSCVNDKKKM
ncbi:unnamed protein product [Brachionus calyciflorus]|uniref:Uncharacterized protein n=1 Tax=Brachionus calyciflorus TaxID=104777 RepID=A0A814JV89_9BILA|nr:unnamed protein product [Brachionus calyciflorus]